MTLSTFKNHWLRGGASKWSELIYGNGPNRNEGGGFYCWVFLSPFFSTFDTLMFQYCTLRDGTLLKKKEEKERLKKKSEKEGRGKIKMGGAKASPARFPRPTLVKFPFFRLYIIVCFLFFVSMLQYPAMFPRPISITVGFLLCLSKARFVTFSFGNRKTNAIKCVAKTIRRSEIAYLAYTLLFR